MPHSSPWRPRVLATSALHPDAEALNWIYTILARYG